MIASLLQSAVGHHNAGRLAQAEALYRQILTSDPAQPDALHLLGVIELQRGQPAVAVDLIQRAIGINANAPEFHLHLGNAFHALNRYADAETSYRAAARLNPNSLEAHSNLGTVLRLLGRLDDSIDAQRRAI